ncbi:MAG: hypothetical protein EOM65_04910 [Synergistales bacterium]|nr:hypothetical protein [Synergistales bacterium]
MMERLWRALKAMFWTAVVMGLVAYLCVKCFAEDYPRLQTATGTDLVALRATLWTYVGIFALIVLVVLIVIRILRIR